MTDEPLGFWRIAAAHPDRPALYADADGTTYTYSPVADAQGFDPNVRYVRIEPKGTFAGTAAAGDPRFDLHFVVRVD